MPLPGAVPEGGERGGLPLSLTLDLPADRDPVGVIAALPRPAWGCLFFSILGISILLAIVSMHYGMLWAALALIVYWTVFNHPSRKAADSVRRALGLFLEGQAKRAYSALEPALRKASDNEAVQYLGGLIALGAGRPDRALEHLTQARPRMQAYAEYHHLLGRALLLRDRRQEARDAFGRALEFAAYPARAQVLAERQEMDGPPAAETLEIHEDP